MQQTLYLLQNQNNYFNRKVILQGVKNEEDIMYNDKVIAVYNELNVPTFDSLRCQVIVNTQTNFGVRSNFPDYAVLITTLDNEEKELTRWFVEKYEKVRGEQYRIDLRRDILADYLNNILTGTAYIEKGYVGLENPLIYNSEGMSFNQIKETESKITDYVVGPWIIGYMARNEEGQKYSVEFSADISNPQGETINFEDLPQTLQNAINFNSQILIDFNGFISFDFTYFQTITTNINKGNWVPSESCLYRTETGGKYAFYGKEKNVGNNLPSNAIFKIVRPNLVAHQVIDFSLAGGSISNSFFNNLDMMQLISASQQEVENRSNYLANYNDYNGIIFKKGQDYFRLHITTSNGEPINLNLSNNNSSYLNLQNAINRAITLNDFLASGSGLTRNWQTGDLKIGTTIGIISIELLNGPQYHVNIPTTRAILVDEPFDMFAIPYNNSFSFRKTKEGSQTIIRKELALNIASAISEKMGARLYDLQLVPYCPIRNLPKSGPSILLSGLIENTDYSLVNQVEAGQETGNSVAVIFFPRTSKGTFTRNITLGEINTAEDMKVENECTFYRIVSPNFSTSYEFSLAKNGGQLKGLNITFDYKPYQPFIRLSLKYGGIYRDSFGVLENVLDARGLIVGGDLSLTRLNSDWTNYQLNNKNYQLMFDREIKNLDTNRELILNQKMINSIMNTSTGTIGGAIGGAYKGGVMGAVAGAMSGALISGTRSFVDYETTRGLELEQRSFKTDMFNYSLENVKAIPYTITKISAINDANKGVPILEKYSCTSAEKEAFRQKLKYNGYTIMAIGKISEYVNIENESFIKAQLIRIEDASIDTNVANELYNEVNKGFYIDIGGYSNGN